MNLAILLYVSYFRRIVGQLKNRLEMFNEYMVCCVTQQMVFFSDWVCSVDSDLLNVRWKYGHFMNAVIGYFIYANLSIFIFFTSKNIYLIYTKLKLTVNWSLLMYQIIMKLNDIYRAAQIFISGIKSFIKCNPCKDLCPKKKKWIYGVQVQE